MDKVISYAQNREDLILAGFFEDEEKGFYVDIGANSPDKDSVTKYFYERGWTGINIEPIRGFYEQLERYRPKDININAGVSNKSGTLELREYTGTGLSTFSDTLKKQYQSSPDYFTTEFKDYKVEVITLAELFNAQKVKSINFMKVDVEGYEYNVLDGNDWELYRPNVICIEANHIEQDWHKLLIDNKYKKIFFDGLNEYYVDSTANIKDFSYVNAVINKGPIVSYLLAPELKRLELSHEKLLNLEKELELKSEQIAHLQSTLGEVTPLRRHLKRQLKAKLKNLNKRTYDALKSRNKYVPLALSDAKEVGVVDVDKINFDRYNQSKQAPFMLKVYLKVTGTTIRMASKILRITKV